MSIRQGISRKSLLSAAAAGLFAAGLTVSPVWAHEHHEGYEHYHHHHHHDHEVKPHNAALHMLMLAHVIGLKHDQVQKLMKMRDEYIRHNAVAEKMIKVERMDLKWLLYADHFDKMAVNKKLEDIGKLEGQLWDAYVNQLAQISTLLTQQQKDKLKEIYSPHHHMKMEERDHEHGMGEHEGEHGEHGGSMMNNMDD